MKVGIPREIKNHEYRVAITPAGVHELVRGGHQVVIEAGSGGGLVNSRRGLHHGRREDPARPRMTCGPKGT